MRSNSRIISFFAVVFMLLLATPITIIIAQNTDLNESLSRPVTGEVVAEPPVENPILPEQTSSQDTQSETPPQEQYANPPTEIPIEIPPQEQPVQEPAKNPPEQSQDNTTENTTIEEPVIAEPVNISANETTGNESIIILDNETIQLPENQTQKNPINESPTENVTTEIPSNETNQTETPPKIIQPIPFSALAAGIQSPDKITRGETFEAIATVSNSGIGSADNVRITWNLPAGFDITNSAQYNCDTIEPGSFCESRIEISVSLEADLGKSNIGVRVSYE